MTYARRRMVQKCQRGASQPAVPASRRCQPADEVRCADTAFRHSSQPVLQPVYTCPPLSFTKEDPIGLHKYMGMLS